MRLHRSRRWWSGRRRWRWTRQFPHIDVHERPIRRQQWGDKHRWWRWRYRCRLKQRRHRWIGSCGAPLHRAGRRDHVPACGQLDSREQRLKRRFTQPRCPLADCNSRLRDCCVVLPGHWQFGTAHRLRLGRTGSRGRVTAVRRRVQRRLATRRARTPGAYRCGCVVLGRVLGPEWWVSAVDLYRNYVRATLDTERLLPLRPTGWPPRWHGGHQLHGRSRLCGWRSCPAVCLSSRRRLDEPFDRG
ncbi:unannotated protein [freshwater metagenome]|uniref:Unannotated protein n=1 Tax=freshwater metagenome TaxID=449393 RepID=A0A6J6U4Q5_9ZZZZ